MLYFSFARAPNRSMKNDFETNSGFCYFCSFTVEAYIFFPKTEKKSFYSLWLFSAFSILDKNQNNFLVSSPANNVFSHPKGTRTETYSLRY